MLTRYVTISSKKAGPEKTFPNLNILLKSLEKEEIWLSDKNLLNTVQDNILSELSRGKSRGRGSERDYKNQRNWKKVQSRNQNSLKSKDYPNITYYKCNKIDYLIRNYSTK